MAVRPALRIATWNINSVRRRVTLLAALAEEGAPDVVCLQETKVVDELFPREAAAAAGYPYVALNGMKNYNGVAILSRVPFRTIGNMEWCTRRDARHVAVEIDGGGAMIVSPGRQVAMKPKRLAMAPEGTRISA